MDSDSSSSSVSDASTTIFPSVESRNLDKMPGLIPISRRSGARRCYNKKLDPAFLAKMCFFIGEMSRLASVSEDVKKSLKDPVPRSSRGRVLKGPFSRRRVTISDADAAQLNELLETSAKLESLKNTLFVGLNPDCTPVVGEAEVKRGTEFLEGVADQSHHHCSCGVQLELPIGESVICQLCGKCWVFWGAVKQEELDLGEFDIINSE